MQRARYSAGHQGRAADTPTEPAWGNVLVLSMRFQGDFKEFCKLPDSEHASNQTQQKLQWLLQEHTEYSRLKFDA